MRKGINKKFIIFISAAIMILASVSLFAHHGNGYGRGGYGRNRGNSCGYNNNYYNRGNYNGCYYYSVDNNQLAK